MNPEVLNQAVAHAATVPFVSVFTLFVLAIFVGYYVVWGVTPALHTPLMAVTNALSGVVIVGAMLQVVSSGVIGADPATFQDITLTSLLGAFAVFLASINIFGGFAVTERMLAMFKKKK
ncbi:MAG: NAD(P) transhydrogenase subunit alpha [Aquirhabdus sp.]